MQNQSTYDAAMIQGDQEIFTQKNQSKLQPPSVVLFFITDLFAGHEAYVGVMSLSS